jgi:hypothetical protein
MPEGLSARLAPRPDGPAAAEAEFRDALALSHQVGGQPFRLASPGTCGVSGSPKPDTRGPCPAAVSASSWKAKQRRGGALPGCHPLRG